MTETSVLTKHQSAAGQRGLSGCWLKMIAVITMLVDHTAATILERLLAQQPDWAPITQDNYQTWLGVYFIMRLIGRMAFPIYCFLLVEGFHYTKNRAKYALRLFVFALISEVPFDMAFNQCFFSMDYNSVFLTLLIGLLAIWAGDALSKRIKLKATEGIWSFLTELLKWLVVVAILLIGGGLAELLHTDYGASGVIAIGIMYLFYSRRMVGFGLMVLFLGMFAGVIEWMAFLMLIPMHFYNGTRGKQMKYFFYAFYPAHLLILSLICYFLGLGI